MLPKISIIIPCRNEEKYIPACLDSLVHCQYDHSALEVLVCDGLSEDRTAEIIREYEKKYPFIRYVENPMRATPHALNLGIKNSSGEYVMILGAHAEIFPDYLNVCVDILQNDNRIGCVGGMMESIYSDQRSRVIAGAMSSPFGVGSAHFRTGMKEGWVDTAAFGVYRRKIFEEIGLFDETLIRNQDDELNYRLTKAGHKIWLTRKAKLKYYVRSSFENLFRQYYQYGYWKVYVNKKHSAITTLRQLVPALFVLFLFTGAVAAIFSAVLLKIYLSVLSLYLLSAIFASFRTIHKISDFFKTVWAFFILHFGYGTGYLHGIGDMVVRSKKPGELSQWKLSR